MQKDMIRYDLLAQEALRGVVRKVLSDVVKTGLPGDHHFFIAFATDYPGVRLSQRLREQHAGEMTVVLQHQFWDLAVTEHAFEVGLSFGGVPERLLVPFDAITQFFDPSANFGLKFEVMDQNAAEAPPPAPAAPPAPPKPVSSLPVSTKKTAAPPKGAGTEPQAVPPSTVPRMRPNRAEGEAPPASSHQDDKPPDPSPEGGGGARVVSLDKFRKK